MNTIPTQKNPDLLERSRDTVLNYGYDLIVFKSKAKKYVAILKSQLSSYYF